MPDIDDSIQKQFGNVAANYSTSAVHVKGADLDAMVTHTPVNETARVLDAGCGAGHTGFAFAPHVAQVVAYDLTPAMLAQVRQNAAERDLNNITTQRGSVESLPFDPVSFDVVVSRYSAHHWGDPQTALDEFRRVLKPGGTFTLSDIVAPEAFALDTFLQTIELLRDPSHVRDHRVSEWVRMFEAAGFTVEVVFRHDLALHFGDWLTRMATPEAHVHAIESLINGAPETVKGAFHLPEQIDSHDFDFTIPGAVLRGQLR